jgi:mono/diheme cytochrome c family protein
MNRLCKAGLVVLGLAGLAGVGFIAWIVSHGVSARDEPTAAEGVVARMARHLAVPGALRQSTNPVTETEEVLTRARAHFADHCALCHANDGSGQTAIGRKLYPKAPDMRLAATQSMTDGELFAIIRNGVRLTGMPAWGDGSPESDRESWELVLFIRHLPRITPEELEGMRGLNPRGAAEWEEERRAEEFLAGGVVQAAGPRKIKGILWELTQDKIVVMVDETKLSAALTVETKYRNGTAKASRDDLKIDQKVVVTVIEKDGATIALEVRIAAPPSPHEKK